MNQSVHEASTKGRWSVVPAGAALGARIEGIDLREPLTDVDRDALLAHWMESQVLVFPGQKLSDQQLVAFTRRFGDPEIFHQDIIKSQRIPEIFRVANVDEDDNLLPPDDLTVQQLSNARMWHTDSSYREVPSTGTLLYGREVTREGGITQFSNMYAVLDALPDRLRAKVEGRKARHNFGHLRTLKNLPPLSAKDAAAMPPVWQPMIRRHPVTGRNALYLSYIYNDQIEGMDPEQAKDLLQELIEFTGEQRFVYGHRWTAGDLLMWDNRCTVHQVTPYDYSERRILHRTTIVGDEPVVAG